MKRLKSADFINKYMLDFYSSVACGIRYVSKHEIDAKPHNKPLLLVRRAELLKVLNEIVDDDANVLENLNKLIKFIE
mgnify:CR=1 FL=1